jgi:hypothetical protein
VPEAVTGPAGRRSRRGSLLAGRLIPFGLIRAALIVRVWLQPTASG